MRIPRRNAAARLAPALVAIAVVTAACGGGADKSAPADRPSTAATTDPTAPLAGATTVSGAPFDVATLEGRPTVAWFWAPWCVICRAEGPDVAEVAARYGGRVNVVGVAGRDELDAMADFVTDTGTGSLTHLADLDATIWSAYGVYGQPAFAFIDTDGTVEVFVGSLGARALTDQIDALLA